MDYLALIFAAALSSVYVPIDLDKRTVRLTESSKVGIMIIMKLFLKITIVATAVLAVMAAEVAVSYQYLNSVLAIFAIILTMYVATSTIQKLNESN